MTIKQKQELIDTARKLQTKKDPSHDFQHVIRVLNMSLELAKQTKADEERVIPSALFHDIIVHQKNSSKK